MVDKELYNKKFFLSYMWKEFRKRLNITQTELAKKLWVSQTYVNSVLNGEASIKGYEKLLHFAQALWLTSQQFDKIYKEAREAEYEHSTGLPIRWLDLDEYEKEELLKVLFHREWSREPSQQDIEAILSVIRGMR